MPRLKRQTLTPQMLRTTDRSPTSLSYPRLLKGQFAINSSLFLMRMGCFQSFSRLHSTETVLLKVISDALLAADRGEGTLLCLLHLSAAFDTVDHDILIDRLQTAFGIRGTVLTWMSSLLKDITQ